MQTVIFHLNIVRWALSIKRYDIAKRHLRRAFWL